VYTVPRAVFLYGRVGLWRGGGVWFAVAYGLPVVAPVLVKVRGLTTKRAGFIKQFPQLAQLSSAGTAVPPAGTALSSQLSARHSCQPAS